MEGLAVTKHYTSIHRFECRSCGHRCRARIQSDGTGVSRSEDLAEAKRKATSVAVANAQSALDLAPCPRCGHRKSSALLGLGAWTLLPALFFTGLGLVLWPLGTLMRVFSAIWFAAALGVVALGWRSLGRGRREVQFLDS